MVAKANPTTASFETQGQALWEGHQTADFRMVSTAWKNIRPGWRLWVKEPWVIARARHHEAVVALFDGVAQIEKVSECQRLIKISREIRVNDFPMKSKCSATSMPRWASRMELHVTKVDWVPCSEIGPAFALKAAMVSKEEMDACGSPDQQKALALEAMQAHVTNRYGPSAWVRNAPMVLYEFVVRRMEESPPGTLSDVWETLPAERRRVLAATSLT